MTSTSPYISNVMNALRKLDEIEQIFDKEAVPGPTGDDVSKTRPLELHSCSTKSREYSYADTIPLGKT